jgi:hypothetical protein
MQNQSTVCTVFEGHYHKGVAALTNSLSANGYEGIIWAAYKGSLPEWARIDSRQEGIEVMQVSEKIILHFVKLADSTFLPYFKPDFMLDILENKMPNVEQIFFFDCDIVVKCRFSYFEEWAKFGVAMCEDVNSPIPVSHPLRFQWKQYFEKYGITITTKDNQYVNGGFIGLQASAKGFLKTWQLVQKLMMEELKEVTNVNYKDRTNPFNCTDQDALNIAKDLTEENLSVADGTAMDLHSYGYIMSHAVGKQKPWHKNWLYFVIKDGNAPSRTDRVFMNYIDTPLSIFSPKERFLKQLNLKLACALGRVLA